MGKWKEEREKIPVQEGFAVLMFTDCFDLCPYPLPEEYEQKLDAEMEAKLLDLRIFDEERETRIFRASIDRPFCVRTLPEAASEKANEKAAENIRRGEQREASAESTGEGERREASAESTAKRELREASADAAGPEKPDEFSLADEQYLDINGDKEHSLDYLKTGMVQATGGGSYHLPRQIFGDWESARERIAKKGLPEIKVRLRNYYDVDQESGQISLRDFRLCGFFTEGWDPSRNNS